MKKALLLLIFALSLSADTLNVALYDFPPCVILEKGKEPSGFDVDVLEAVCRKAELQIRYSYPEKFSDLLSGVEKGIYDGAVSGITITGEREGKVDFTHPYLSSGLSILVNSNAHVNPLKTAYRYVSNVGPMLLLVTLFTTFFGILIFFVEKKFSKNG